MSGPTILALGVLIGFFIPPLSDALRPLLPITVFLFVFGTLLRADLQMLKGASTNFRTGLVFPILSIVLVPLCVGWMMMALGVPGLITGGVVLALASPPSSGNAALARMFGYQGEIPLAIILITTMVAPISMPLVAAVIGIEINPVDLMIGLMKILVLAGLLAVCLRYFFSVFLAKLHAWIDRLVLWSLFVFAIATMDGVLHQFLDNTLFALIMLSAAFATNLLMQGFGYMIAKTEDREAIALAMTFGNRNVGLPWAVLGSALSPATILFFALAQIPIFVLPWIWSLILKAGGKGQRKGKALD